LQLLDAATETKKEKKEETREFKEIKDFLLTCRRPDAKSVSIKENAENTKFKVHCSQSLSDTLVITDRGKADRLKQSIPPGLPKEVEEEEEEEDEDMGFSLFD